MRITQRFILELLRDSSRSHSGIAPVIPSRIPLMISSRTTPENPPGFLLGDLPKSQDFCSDSCLVSSPDFYRDITELFLEICGNFLPELIQRFHVKVQSSYAKIFWSEFPEIPLELLQIYLPGFVQRLIPWFFKGFLSEFLIFYPRSLQWFFFRNPSRDSFLDFIDCLQRCF